MKARTYKRKGYSIVLIPNENYNIPKSWVHVNFFFFFFVVRGGQEVTAVKIIMTFSQPT